MTLPPSFYGGAAPVSRTILADRHTSKLEYSLFLKNCIIGYIYI